MVGVKEERVILKWVGGVWWVSSCSLFTLQTVIQQFSFQCLHAATALLGVLTFIRTCMMVYAYSKAKVTEGGCTQPEMQQRKLRADSTH